MKRVFFIAALGILLCQCRGLTGGEKDRGIVIIKTADGQGSGFVVAYQKTHYVVTAYHVVADADYVRIVKPQRQNSYNLEVIGEVIKSAPTADLAIIKMMGSGEADILGAPLELADEKVLSEINTTDKKSLEVYGAGESTLSQTGMSPIRSVQLQVSQAYNSAVLNVYNPWTMEKVEGGTPKGFIGTGNVTRGFSGGPCMYGDYVVGVAYIATTPNAPAPEAACIGAPEIETALREADEFVKLRDRVAQDHNAKAPDLENLCNLTTNALLERVKKADRDLQKIHDCNEEDCYVKTIPDFERDSHLEDLIDPLDRQRIQTQMDQEADSVRNKMIAIWSRTNNKISGLGCRLDLDPTSPYFYTGCDQADWAQTIREYFLFKMAMDLITKIYPLADMVPSDDSSDNNDLSNQVDLTKLITQMMLLNKIKDAISYSDFEDSKTLSVDLHKEAKLSTEVIEEGVNRENLIYYLKGSDEDQVSEERVYFTLQHGQCLLRIREEEGNK